MKMNYSLRVEPDYMHMKQYKILSMNNAVANLLVLYYYMVSNYIVCIVIDKLIISSYVQDYFYEDCMTPMCCWSYIACD